MKNLYVFGNELNGLEFTTYILFPSSILLVILIYIYFNYDYIKISFDFNIDFLDEQNNNFKEKYNKLKERLVEQEKIDNKDEIYMEEKEKLNKKEIEEIEIKERVERKRKYEEYNRESNKSEKFYN